jgi:hypothetical protein
MAFGIEGTNLNKCTMVDVVANKNKIGTRKFEAAIEVATNLCKILNIDLEIISYQNRFRASQSIKSDSIVDVSVIRHLQIPKILTKKCIIIGTGLENLALIRPTLFQVLRDKDLIPQLKRRIDVFRIFILPFRISAIYTLTPKTTTLMCLTSRTLDYENIENKFKEILKENWPTCFESPILESISISKESTLFVIPLAETFGGTYQFNSNLFHDAIEFAHKNSFKRIMIKNHPADDTNYLEKFLFTTKVLKEITLVQANSDFDRTIPVEVLALSVSDFAIYGFISSAHFSLMNFTNRGMIMILPDSKPPGSVWSDYSIGYAKPIFKGTIKYI